MKYGRAIRQVREARGWSQRALARELGVAPSYVSLLESGKRSPSARMLESIATTVEVPIPVLMLLAAEASELRGIPVKEAQALSKQLLAILSSQTRADDE